MAGKTVPVIVAEALEDLSPEQLAKFRLRLRESKSDGLRIRRAQVEGKDSVELADLVVQTFSRDRAVQVTVELLRAIGCSEVAADLGVEAKDLLQPAQTKQDSPSAPAPGASAAPDGERRNASHLNVTPSTSESGPSTVQANGSVKRPRQGGPELSQQQLQIGQYKGQRFEWLLQNDVEYAGYMVATHRKDRAKGITTQTKLMKNKDALSEYVSLFPEAEEEVLFYHQGQAPLGYGKYKKVTHYELYISQENAKKKYVKWLRSQKNNKDPRIKDSAKYVLHRDWRRDHPGISTEPPVKKQKH